MNYNKTLHRANMGWNSFHLVLETGLIIRMWGPKNASGCVSAQRECLCLLVLIAHCWYPGDGKELIKLFILAGLATQGAREEGWRDAPLQSSKRWPFLHRTCHELPLNSQWISTCGDFFKNTFITSFNHTICFSQSLVSWWWQPKRLLCPNFCLGHILTSLLVSQFTTNSVCFL